MNKILICCVNYGSYTELNNYIKSIDESASHVVDMCEVVVCIADNTEFSYQNIDIDTQSVLLKKFPYHKNMGYMGGAVQVLKDLGLEFVSSFDYVIVSNVDLEMPEVFLSDLIKCKSSKLGWIVPSIYRLRNNMSNENPFQLNKPSLYKLKFLIFLYKQTWLFDIYTYIRKMQLAKCNNNKYINQAPFQIYAGSGSFMIFTKEMISKAYPLDFPSFMYGEELYYGYLVEKYNLKTIFYPKLSINDICSVSTGKLGSKMKYKMNYTSLQLLSKVIYND